jgi:hypothetical protein
VIRCLCINVPVCRGRGNSEITSAHDVLGEITFNLNTQDDGVSFQYSTFILVTDKSRVQAMSENVLIETYIFLYPGKC